jgi:hypothetical protein
VVDLAETCQMFDAVNYKAAGVCFNNIANIQFKNQRYELAAQNYTLALIKCNQCLAGEFYETHPQEIMELQAKDRTYFEKIRANRYYQFAICKYKDQRYSQHPKGDWLEVDAYLRNSIIKYKSVLCKCANSRDKPVVCLYIDIMISLIIKRCYACHMSRKLITAQRMLTQIKALLDLIEDGSVAICDNAEERLGVQPIPLAILKSKYFLHKGLLELKIAPDSTETLKNFEKVVNDPSPIFDAKVRKAALEQLEIWVPKSDNPNRPKLI